MTNPSANLDLELPPARKRIGDFKAAKAIFEKLRRADEPRNKTRSMARGLVDGNAPFRNSSLRNAGQMHRTNINCREGESFLSMATGAFYDMSSEAQTYYTVECDYDENPDKNEDDSGVVTEEFDKLLKRDKTSDFNRQLSNREMVLIGTGPLIWKDELDYRDCAIEAGDLLLPERTKANIDEWGLAIIRDTYNVAQLHGYIEDAKTAGEVGWKVENARKVIKRAFPDNQGSFQDWEYYQSQIRANDAQWAITADEIRIAHIYVKEFDGKITHQIIQETDGEDFLFEKVGRFEKWQNIICPFYYDRGDGRHHGVKGMGVKMYGLLEVKNRLKCALIDSAFMETMLLLQGADATSTQEASIVPMGPYAIVKSGMNTLQRTFQTRLESPMAVDKELGSVLEGNLSQYRRGIEKDGNPRTAEEIRAIMGQAAALGKTQVNRHYEQLDEYGQEKYRRASNPELSEDDPGGKEALEFQRACIRRGVSKRALKEARVTATRIAGQGSPMMRQSVLTEILSILPELPEAGRLPVLRDFIASRVGQTKVDRYAPKNLQSKETQDQAAQAQMENGVMKAGVMPIRTGTQNDLVHAQVHIQGATETLQQQGDPGLTVAFLDIWGPHTGAHLQALGQSKTRKAEYDALFEQFNQIGKAADELKKQIQQQQEQAAEAQAQMQQAAAIQQGTDPETAVMQAKAQQDMQNKQAKSDQNLQIKAAKARQDFALKDAKMAHDILSKPTTETANAK